MGGSSGTLKWIPCREYSKMLRFHQSASNMNNRLRAILQRLCECIILIVIVKLLLRYFFFSLCSNSFFYSRCSLHFLHLAEIVLNREDYTNSAIDSAFSFTRTLHTKTYKFNKPHKTKTTCSYIDEAHKNDIIWKPIELKWKLKSDRKLWRKVIQYMGLKLQTFLNKHEIFSLIKFFFNYCQ